jgi:hypothetical protein
MMNSMSCSHGIPGKSRGRHPDNHTQLWCPQSNLSSTDSLPMELLQQTQIVHHLSYWES